MPKLHSGCELLLTIFRLLWDSLRLIGASLQPRCRMAAENLFLRKQLALYLERQVKPRRAEAATRLTLVLLSRLFVWREVLTVVKPETFIRWHRQGFRLFWRWKSKPRGRPRAPAELRKTFRRYLPPDLGPRRGTSSQRWMTFVRNHAEGILCCDFFVTETATFRLLYVFVVMEVGTRRIAHFNVTAHPTADWTLQKFREVQPYSLVIHDRDRRPHSGLGPGIPEPGGAEATPRIRDSERSSSLAEPILGGLHHEYRLERVAA